MDMQAFDFIDCRIEGPLEFRRCNLAGGSIEGSRKNKSSIIKGPITFLDQSDLSAISLVSLDFSNQKLEMRDCSANAIYFENVTLWSDEHNIVNKFVNTSMASGMFHNCRLHNVIFQGSDEQPIAMEALIIRGTRKDNSETLSTLGCCEFSNAMMNNLILDDVAINGPVSFHNCTLSASRIGNHKPDSNPEHNMRVSSAMIFDGCDLRALHWKDIKFYENAAITVRGGSCDGAVFQHLVLGGTFLIEKSSLLRSKFEDITSRGNGCIDIQTSELYFAQFDDTLLDSGSEPGEGNHHSQAPVQMSRGQLNNALKQAREYKNIGKNKDLLND
jgi:uncharacterized protein YjbI with pentapeptide repeats